MYDAIVVGARCAGSPTAMPLARKGYKVLLVSWISGLPSMEISRTLTVISLLGGEQYRETSFLTKKISNTSKRKLFFGTTRRLGAVTRHGPKTFFWVVTSKATERRLCLNWTSP